MLHPANQGTLTPATRWVVVLFLHKSRSIVVVLVVRVRVHTPVTDSQVWLSQHGRTGLPIDLRKIPC